MKNITFSVRALVAAALIPLSLLPASAGDSEGVFDVTIQGTLTGQTGPDVTQTVPVTNATLAREIAQAESLPPGKVGVGLYVSGTTVILFPYNKTTKAAISSPVAAFNLDGFVIQAASGGRQVLSFVGTCDLEPVLFEGLTLGQASGKLFFRSSDKLPLKAVITFRPQGSGQSAVGKVKVVTGDRIPVSVSF